MSALDDRVAKLEAVIEELLGDLSAVPAVAAARRARKDAAERVEHERIKALAPKARAEALAGLDEYAFRRLVAELRWEDARDLLAGGLPKSMRAKVEALLPPTTLEAIALDARPLRPYSRLTPLHHRTGQEIEVDARAASELRALGPAYVGRLSQVAIRDRGIVTYFRAINLVQGDAIVLADDVLAVLRRVDQALDADIAQGRVIVQPLDPKLCKIAMSQETR